MPINASLFAHIENDSELSGTYGLEGNRFRNTVAYLKDYIQTLTASKQEIPKEYSGLLQHLEHLAEAEQRIEALFTSTQRESELRALATALVSELIDLPEKAEVLLPGGWHNSDGGHAIIYEFTRTEDGYVFTVFNAGDGLQYHGKKSIKEKELYNPTKSWHIPNPKSTKEKDELIYFIARLFKARMPFDPLQQKKPVNGTVFYQEILASIIHVNGVELDNAIGFPEHAYTGGQLSGTCSQRAIHQMLKIKSKSAKEYQRFIFNFKQYALVDYVNECLQGRQPLTAAVVDQMNHALKNNLKILNTKKIFTQLEITEQLSLCAELQKKLQNAVLPIKVTPTKAQQIAFSLSIKSVPLQAPKIPLDVQKDSNKTANLTHLNNGVNLLANMNLAIENCALIQDPALQYSYLQQLILELPLNPGFPASTGFYAELTTMEHFHEFQRLLGNIQVEFHHLEKSWLKEEQIPVMNVMFQCLISLRIDAYNVTPKSSKMPSFMPFSAAIMRSLIGNQERNPFNATNHPGFDKKIKELQERYKDAPLQYPTNYYNFFNAILDTEPGLKEELSALYQKEFCTNNTELHFEIRKYRLEALFMIAQHHNRVKFLHSRFQPLIDKIETHLNHENKLRSALNPFYVTKYSRLFNIAISHKSFRINSSLFPTFVPYEQLLITVPANKYALKDSPARQALMAHVSDRSNYKHQIKPKSANHIQLTSIKSIDPSEGLQRVSQEDIEARDYFHLRSEPSFQIALTLDYFTRHIKKLSEETNQRYVEANLFEPGLLLHAIEKPSFLPQFDTFLQTGLRYFTENGLHSHHSILFVRLNFLVSQYLNLNGDPKGFERLAAMQSDLEKQLPLTGDPEITYALQQYLLLILMQRMEKESCSDELFILAYKAYAYINSHTNPLILEDKTHRFEMESTRAKFQVLIQQQTTTRVQSAVEQVLLSYETQTNDSLVISGNFPEYQLNQADYKKQYQFNALTGQLFEKGLAHGGVPLSIQNHPLIKHLELATIRECLINAKSSYMILKSEDQEIHLFHNEDQLTVQKQWIVQGKKERYELQALTEEHEAKHAHEAIAPVLTNLPQILTDGSMDYWKSTENAQEGLLTRKNKPLYAIRTGKIWALDENGKDTGYQLFSPNNPLFNRFESDQFILSHRGTSDSIVKLPRYNLNLTIQAGIITYPETGEIILDKPSPIDSAVAGLLLGHNDQERYLVPVARFYATEQDTEESAFYPVVHDTSGAIAQAYLQEHWTNTPPVKEPLWRFDNSERCVNFQLKDGQPIADTVADALYLVYIYLATNQPEKAWSTLEECNTRLGGLTGHPEELKFITWICKDLPHVLPSSKSEYERNKPLKRTPPYVACQLKSMSLLCDYLNQKGTFDLKATETPLDTTANAEYARLQQSYLQQFLNTLPQTVYTSFTRLQTMHRHLEHSYKLSSLERKRLLNYYHHSKPKDHAPRGALGCEWLNLSLESLLEERDALLAQRSADHSLSVADEHRLQLINKHLKRLKPAVAKSTVLELVSIDLNIPPKSQINNLLLKTSTIEQYERWHHRLPGDLVSEKEMNEAIAALSSDISEDNFILNFPAYLQLALSKPSSSGLIQWAISFIKTPEEDIKEPLRKKLLDFCSKTLIAARHISLDTQDSNIPLLCNVLYRTLSARTATENAFFQGNTKLSDLLDVLSSQNAEIPPLKVYQPTDIYEEILARPEDIIAAKETRVHTTLAIEKPPQTSLITQLGIAAKLQESPINETLNKLIARYQELQNKGDEQLKILAVRLSNNTEEILATEEQAGVIHFNFAQEKHTLAQSLITNTEIAEAILSANAARQSELEQQIDKAWSEALKLANQGPGDYEKAIEWTIERGAKVRAPLTRADLLALYSRASLAHNIEKTGLDPNQAQQLHELTHQALLFGIQSHTIDKISNGLEKALNKNDPNTAAQALDLLARIEIPGLEEPSIVLLQHEEQIILHQRQVTALQSLLKNPGDERRFHETIEKIIMGGGKSKVILPILAEKKAQGDNLVVVEVPPALLATNHVDLNRTSQRLFGKRAYRFEFNRDSDCSPERLSQIYQLFTEVMTSRSYLVTTGEAIQSLELKYIELLLSNEEHNERWKEQVYWCDKITKLFHHHADCIIDEVHQGLSIKKRLNYTFGEPKPLNSTLIKNATALFSFISSEFINEAPAFDESYDWRPFQIELASKLVNDPNSPLYAFVSHAVLRYGSSIKEKLIAYLCNEAETIPEAIINASAEAQSSLAFFKQEINVRLPQTLSQKLDKHYGASRRKGLTSLEKTLAIPYAASNVPNERNRFANELESINKTIQMMLIKGISKELLIEQINEWQALAHQELFQNPALTKLDDTPTARGFALLTSGLGLTLSQINSESHKQMDELHGRLQFNRQLIFDVLRESSLKQIQQDSAILSSDNFNHVDQYRSVQGVSGTPPWNNTTYHQRLKYDKNSSLGTDGYIYEIISHKKPVVSGLDYQNATQFVNALLKNSQSPDHTRAIIDIKGAFTGVSNLSVAQEIANYIKNKPQTTIKPLKHILYFNEEQVLCAIRINKPNHPIVLGTSETKVLNRLLDSTPEERFTYFDQIHTTGTDITQEEQAHALVLVDDKTSLQEFLQGSMRLRQLELQQSMEIVIPQRMKEDTLSDLYQKFKKNDLNTTAMDAPSAAKGQMKNYIRRSFLSLIQDIPSEEAEKKAALMQQFKPLFEESPSLDLFALYGKLHKKQAIRKILKHYQDQLKNMWEECLNAAGLKPYQEDIQRVGSELETIIAKAIPFCLAEYESVDDTFSTEVEVQKEVEQEVEEEVLTLNECYSPNFREEGDLTWSAYWDYTQFFSEAAHVNEITMPLNTVCAQEGKETPKLFSQQLKTSKNYARTYKMQTQYTDVFLKPVFLVWYQLENNILTATIVTPQEAKQLGTRIKGLTSSWISTTQDTLIAGNQPKEILLDESYQSLREQVRFFNGEFTGLLNQETPLIWLNEKAVEKIEFFEHTLMSYRPGSSAALNQLQVALTQAKAEGFSYIANHPFENLTQFNWLSLFPKINAPQVLEYKKVAEAFVYLNHNWLHKTISLDDLQQQFRLPINSLIYINTHLNHLNLLKPIINRLQHYSPNQPVLLNLKDNERRCIEECLGMSINQLYEQLGAMPPISGVVLNMEELELVSIASIRVLNILRSYPALENINFFNPYFEACARQAQSIGMLHALLNSTELSIRLLQNIIEHPLCDDSIILALFELKPDLPEALLLTVVEHCKTKQQIDLLLKQKNYNDCVLHKLLRQKHLTNELLLYLLPHAKNDTALELIGTHPAVKPNLTKAVLQHSLLSPKLLLSFLAKRSYTDDELLLILKHPSAITNEVLADLIKLTHIKSPLLLALITHKATNEALIRTAINHQAFTPKIADRLVEQSCFNTDLLKHLVLKSFEHYVLNQDAQWEELIIKLFKKSVQTNVLNAIEPIIKQNKSLIRAEFGLKLFKIAGEEILDSLPITRMIQSANEKELDRFIALRRSYSSLDVTTLAHKTQNTAQIDALLARHDMNAEVADILFQKQEYSGKIGVWNWLTKPQLLGALNSTRSYDSFRHALTHLNLSMDARSHWFEQISTQQEEAYEKSRFTKNPQLKLTAALDLLKIKAYSHAIQAIDKPKYDEVATTAFNLYQSLRTKIDTYFDTPKSNAIQLKEECQKAIDKAKPILEVHRGYKQLFLDIINLLFAAVSWLKTGDWRLFKANTESMNIANQINEHVGKQITIEKNGEAP